MRKLSQFRDFKLRLRTQFDAGLPNVSRCAQWLRLIVERVGRVTKSIAANKTEKTRHCRRFHIACIYMCISSTKHPGATFTRTRKNAIHNNGNFSLIPKVFYHQNSILP